MTTLTITTSTVSGKFVGTKTILTSKGFTILGNDGRPVLRMGDFGPTLAEKRASDQGKPWWKRVFG